MTLEQCRTLAPDTPDGARVVRGARFAALGTLWIGDE